MKTFKQSVIDETVGEPEYYDQILLAARQRLEGSKLDLNQVLDQIYDSAMVALAQRSGSESVDADLGDYQVDIEKESGAV